MDLVDEEHVAVLEVGEQRGQVAGPGQDRARPVMRSPAPISAATMPASDVLPRPGRAGEEDVVDGLAALAGRLEHDAEVLDQLGLPDELGERTGPEPDLFELLVGVRRRRVDHPRPATAAPSVAGRSSVAVDGQDLPARPGAHRLASSRSARRSISSTPTSSRRPSSAPRISSGA